MKEAIDFQKIKRELIAIYQKFLNDGEKEEAIDEAIKYDRIYGGLVSEHYINYIPDYIVKAIERLSDIYQYGMRPRDKGYSNDELVSLAKKILENLKRSQ
jgi:hypothetical protein